MNNLYGGNNSKAGNHRLEYPFWSCVLFTSFSPDEPPTEEEDELAIPKPDIVLNPNHPNPNNPQTTISFEVLAHVHEEAEIRIYNQKGQLVKILKLKVNGKGRYEIVWNGTDILEKSVSGGLYVSTVRCEYLFRVK